MTILDEMEAALRFYESAWVNNSYGSADGDPGKRLLADKGQRARETLRKYEALKGRVVVVPVEPSEYVLKKMYKAFNYDYLQNYDEPGNSIEGAYEAMIQAAQEGEE